MSNKIQATLRIDDMACSGCADTVQNALTGISGVEEAGADHEKGTASVTYDPSAVSADAFRQAVEDAEYTFKGLKS